MEAVQLGASRAVCKVLSGRNLEQALTAAMRTGPALAPQQCAAVQDLSYGTLRFYGQLAHVLSLLLHKPLQDDRVRCLLLVALYQLLYGKAAPYAVVDHAVRTARDLNVATSGLVNAVLRNFLREREALLAAAAESDEGRFAYPQWWIDALKDQYGLRAEGMLLAGNQHPPMTLRVNCRRTTPGDYLELLGRKDIRAQLIAPGAVLLARPMPVDKLPGFSDGLVSVQDAGAQYAAHLLDVHDGMRVLDACAAPGGKTAHILELAGVDLVAVDNKRQRLERVQENLQRLQLRATLQCGDAMRPAGWWDGTPFQRILADVPCSGSGVVRRHPDIKWLRRSDDTVGFSQQQARILAALWELLENGGKLLYATCSVFAQENHQVIEEFKRQHGDARQLPLAVPGMDQGQLLPTDQHDGFFYALLQKQA